MKKENQEIIDNLNKVADAQELADKLKIDIEVADFAYEAYKAGLNYYLMKYIEADNKRAELDRKLSKICVAFTERALEQECNCKKEQPCLNF